MNIFFSGIGGVAIGPLAQIAADAGYQVQGSDMHESLMTRELRERHIAVSIGQDGRFLQHQHDQQPIDWFVHTAALPDDHPELELAKQLGIKTAKRDELLARIISDKQLTLIAVAGTHGKTTTSGMLVWTLQQLGIPVSYSVGSTMSFGPSGAFVPGSTYFVYECDEFDRNFLHFSPQLSLLTSLGYDHPDTYPTESDYRSAFSQFFDQSQQLIAWQHDVVAIPTPESSWLLQDTETIAITLPGEHNRRNASLVLKAIEYLEGDVTGAHVALEQFPGTGRRFEKLADNLYSDYGHHPVEIAATLQMAREISEKVVLVYQPHQNIRQHEIKEEYTDCFKAADHIFWLPTYLSREDPSLPILTPEQLTANITNSSLITISELDEQLWKEIQTARQSGALVLGMGACSIDEWLRQQLSISTSHRL